MSLKYKNISKNVLQLRRERVHPGGTFVVEEALATDSDSIKDLFRKDALAAEDFVTKKLVKKVTAEAPVVVKEPVAVKEPVVAKKEMKKSNKSKG